MKKGRGEAMSRPKRLVGLIVCALMLLMGNALADSDNAAGGFAVQDGTVIYLAVSTDGTESLYSIPSTGGEMTLLDQADALGQLVNTAQGVYYLRNQGTPEIVHAGGWTLAEFEQGQGVSGLCYYDSALYCLVDGCLTRVGLDGMQEPLSDLRMDEFVLKGEEVLYTSAEDRKGYEEDGQIKEAGRLYRLNMASGAQELMLDAGVEDLKLMGDYLYFHNLDDAYLGQEESEDYISGRLYRLRLSDGALSAVNCDVDLDYFPTDSGLVLRTPWDISRCSLSGGDVKQLLATDQPVNLAVSSGDALVYMQNERILLRAPLNGSQVEMLGRILDEQPEEAVEEAEAGDSAGQADGEYIFPNSDKERLERAQVEALDPELLPYARNEIYARHGYEFQNEKYAEYFAGKSWYRPGGFSKSDLNSIEWYNMDLIAAVEETYSQDQGGTPQTADYIFPDSDKYKLTREEIEQVDSDLWPYARNEIYARHGYVFNNEKYARYFMKKSWYKPGGFSESSLSSVEWYNMELIQQMENELAG